ncbi:MAG: hypothetical protein ACU836_05800 [Gammaproteobacteria bacterium]
MDICDIPNAVTVTSGLFQGVFTTTSPRNAETRSWYPPLHLRDSWPHVTVGSGDHIEDTVPVTDFLGNPVSLKKLWWYKLHVSVDIGGRNLQMFYKINCNWNPSPCGNSIKYIPSHNQELARGHANRQSTDYKVFASAFIAAARKEWIDSTVRKGAPKSLSVGPQVASTFYNFDGL